VTDQATSASATRLRPAARRIERATAQLAGLYPDLFEATTRGQGGREHASMNRNDPPGPSRVEVLDLIREVNSVVLDLRRACAAALGYNPATAVGPADVRYRQSPHVLAALVWIGRVAWQLDDAGWADHVLQVLDGDETSLLRACRRLLGLTERIVALGYACPASAPQNGGETPSQVCGGLLVAVPGRGLVVCRGCGQRWDATDWEALGRTVRALAAPADDQDPDQDQEPRAA